MIDNNLLRKIESNIKLKEQINYKINYNLKSLKNTNSIKNNNSLDTNKQSNNTTNKNEMTNNLYNNKHNTKSNFISNNIFKSVKRYKDKYLKSKNNSNCLDIFYRTNLNKLIEVTKNKQKYLKKITISYKKTQDNNKIFVSLNSHDSINKKNSLKVSLQKRIILRGIFESTVDSYYSDVYNFNSINNYKPNNIEMCTINISNNKNSNKILVLYGGIETGSQDKYKIFNLKTKEWNIKDTSLNFQHTRYAHTSCNITTHLILIFGGVRNRIKNFEKIYLLEDLILLNTYKNSIITIKNISKESPKARKYHSCCILKNEIYIYGGIDEDNNILKDLWKGKISLTRHLVNWTKISEEDYGIYLNNLISLNNIYETEANNIFENINNNIYAFGGIDENNNLYNDIKYINTKSLNYNKWITIKTKGLKPDKRYASCMIFNDILQKFILFGGKNISGKCLNDLFLFNLINNEWINVKYNDKQPLCRYFHGITTYNNKIFIFGGITNKGYLLGDLEVIKIKKLNH